MKIIQTIEDFDDGCRQCVSISVGKSHLRFRDGEVEDNTLARNFNDVYSIVDFMKLAYEAGVKGESFEIENIKLEENDDE